MVGQTQYSATEQLWAVVPAAGRGSRFGTDLPKQYLSLAGKTVLEHSLSCLLAVPDLVRVVVALSAEDRHFATLSVAGNGRVGTVVGGAERADSVRSALAALADARENDWVLVHDAARPCVDKMAIQRLLDVCRGSDCGGLLALPVVDTLKRGAQGQVAETVDRNALWRAQTPQLFRFGALCSALDACRDQGIAVTDEASAMEHRGYRPLLVEGSQSNIKITYPDDLALAAFYLSEAQQK